MKNGEIKVLITDDHDLIREGLKRIISFEEDIIVVGEANNGKKAISMIKDYRPDVLLLDMNMPIMDGLGVLRKLKEENSPLKTIVLTVENDSKTIHDAINIGADGYVLKDSAGEEIVDAVHSVYRGDKYIDKSLVALLFSGIQRPSAKENSILNELTEREVDVLFYISRGLSNKEIGEKLFISEKTVKNYATNLFRKLGVSDRVHATILALQHNIDDYYQKHYKK
ncbi:response regulator [Vallitalea okinawensis]|uniref:response regulator n=1 Tax=Vallitalea okinawensis TaxID=2078660 RepID=UPI000CFD1D82|nr:response regulator transcription factor [Vallitalea okinawensis]